MSTLTQTVNAFAALGHKGRLQTALFLQFGPASIDGLSAGVGVSKSSISHYLSALVAAGLACRVQGKEPVYQLAVLGRDILQSVK